MTPDPLTDGLVAGRLRSGVDAMRDAVARTALRGADRWTGPFPGGIDIVDRALLPGWVDDRTHLLFDVAATEVAADRSTWHTPAMDASRSFTVSVDLRASDADVVGAPGFYLDRRGFAVGGLGVAAVWAGGGRSVLEQVVGGLRRFSPTPHQLRRLGMMEQAVRLAWTAVDATAHALPDLSGDRLAIETAWARTAVVAACDRVVDEATRIVGPGGLSGSPRLSRTLGDPTIYVRQHHVDLALEALGRDALGSREVLGSRRQRRRTWWWRCRRATRRTASPRPSAPCARPSTRHGAAGWSARPSPRWPPTGASTRQRAGRWRSGVVGLAPLDAWQGGAAGAASYERLLAAKMREDPVHRHDHVYGASLAVRADAYLDVAAPATSVTARTRLSWTPWPSGWRRSTARRVRPPCPPSGWSRPARSASVLDTRPGPPSRPNQTDSLTPALHQAPRDLKSGGRCSDHEATTAP